MPHDEGPVVTNTAQLTASRESSMVIDAVEAGITAARPENVLRERLSTDGSVLRVDGERYDLAEFGEVVVVGGGNAAGHAAAALEGLLGDWLDGGVVVTDDPAETSAIQMWEGSHPVPDERAQAGAASVLERAEAAGEETLVLAVITGGGSALLPAPAGPVTLSDLGALTDQLLRSGAPIDDVNAVRKHVSELKGGRLGKAAAPATVVGLVFSDVATDDPAVVASGPVSPDPTTFEDARAVLSERGIDAPPAVEAYLRSGTEGRVPESPGPKEPVFGDVSVHVLANGFTALTAAARTLDETGVEPMILSSSVRGEAREAAKTHVAIAEEVLATGNPIEPPAAILSGGETTVTVRGDGTGGPNQEFALAAAVELPDDVVLASVDTDGVDGPTDAAGALVRKETAAPLADARSALDSNDVFPFLADREALVRTGPTGTNVNDLRIVLIPG